MCPLALTYTLTAGGQPADSVHSLPCILAGILTTPCGLNVPLTRVRDEPVNASSATRAHLAAGCSREASGAFPSRRNVQLDASLQLQRPRSQSSPEYISERGQMCLLE